MCYVVLLWCDRSCNRCWQLLHDLSHNTCDMWHHCDSTPNLSKLRTPRIHLYFNPYSFPCISCIPNTYDTDRHSSVCPITQPLTERRVFFLIIPRTPLQTPNSNMQFFLAPVDAGLKSPLLTILPKPYLAFSWHSCTLSALFEGLKPQTVEQYWNHRRRRRPSSSLLKVSKWYKQFLRLGIWRHVGKLSSKPAWTPSWPSSPT